MEKSYGLTSEEKFSSQLLFGEYTDSISLNTNFVFFLSPFKVFRSHSIVRQGKTGVNDQLT